MFFTWVLGAPPHAPTYIRDDRTRPRRSLDHMCSPLVVAVVSCRVAVAFSLAIGSDHLPLEAVFDVKTDAV